MDLEKNYKLMKRITMLLTMAVLFVMSYMIVYADDVKSIELGKSYSGVLSKEIDQSVNEFLEKAFNEESYYGEKYENFKFTVKQTAFYKMKEYNGYPCSFSYIIDGNGEKISGFESQYLDNNEMHDTYFLLNEGQEYNIYTIGDDGDNYRFIIENVGNEFTILGDWRYSSKGGTEPHSVKLTLDGVLTISGSWDIGLDCLAARMLDMQNNVKKIIISGNIDDVGSEGDLFTDLETGYDGVFPNVECIDIGSGVKRIVGVPFRDMKNLSEIRFNCKPPAFISLKEWTKGLDLEAEDVADAGIFEGTNTEAHYPAGCKAWSSDVCKNYGGNIKWVADSNLFTDVSPDYWFYDGVNYVNQNKLMTGVGNGAFGPNKATSRAMLATILYRMDGEKKVDEKAAFSDVSSSQYYADAVAWAVKNGIMTGRNNEKFAPNDKATRQELTSAMYQYAKYLEKDVSKQANLSKYKDASMLSSYGEGAREAFAWAVENGIVSGTSDTQLSPNGNASRAQFAVILKRFAENIK